MTLRPAGMKTRHSSPMRATGFTLIELLAVIAIILLLVSLLAPALKTARERADRLTCASNMRSLQLGHSNYSADHDGTMPSSSTGAGDWVDMTGYSVDTVQTLMHGTIWPYVRNERAYRCPLHPFKDYIRTFSLNNYLNGEETYGSWGYSRVARTVGAVPQPAGTISFLEEPDPRKYLMGSWVTYMLPANLNQWVDPVGTWHGQGACTMTFLDGHSEFWKWEDARTMQIGYTFYASTPNNQDLYRVKKHVAPKEPAYAAINDVLP